MAADHRQLRAVAMRRGADVDKAALSTAGAGGGSRFVSAAAIPSACGQDVERDLTARVRDSLARLVGPPCELGINRPGRGGSPLLATGRFGVNFLRRRVRGMAYSL
jgi:hypothetical protein